MQPTSSSLISLSDAARRIKDAYTVIISNLEVSAPACHRYLSTDSSFSQNARWATRAPAEVAAFTGTMNRVNRLRIPMDDPREIAGGFLESLTELLEFVRGLKPSRSSLTSRLDRELERAQGELNVAAKKYDSLKEKLGRGLKKKAPPDECIKLLADCHDRIESHLTKIDVRE